MSENELVETVRSLIGRDDTTIDRPDSIVDGPGSSADAADGFPRLSEMDQQPSDALVELGLTPEQYITDALAAHGGRLRQQAVCDLTGWSDGTVSQNLGALEEDGRIVRFRDGREKIVCLPEHGPPSRETSAGEPQSTNAAPDAPSREPSAKDAPTRDARVQEPVSHD